MMKKFVLIILLNGLLLSACRSASTSANGKAEMTPVGAPTSRSLIVYAAASLTEAFTEVGIQFESSHPGAKITYNFSGSQTLSTQIMQGATADVFASANHTEMDKLVSASLIQRDAPKDFLTNRLVVILPAGNPAHIQTLSDLSLPGIKLVLAADTVPAGKYARQALQKISEDPSFGAVYNTKVLANVVSNENDVRQVLTKVQLGEADAGIVYISDTITAPELKKVEIPGNFNVIAKYPIAPLLNAPQAELAAEFIAYVTSAEGQSILKKWGFTPITP